jgi:hypothetical protein
VPESVRDRHESSDRAVSAVLLFVAGFWPVAVTELRRETWGAVAGWGLVVGVFSGAELLMVLGRYVLARPGDCGNVRE